MQAMTMNSIAETQINGRTDHSQAGPPPARVPSHPFRPDDSRLSVRNPTAFAASFTLKSHRIAPNRTQAPPRTCASLGNGAYQPVLRPGAHLQSYRCRELIYSGIAPNRTESHPGSPANLRVVGQWGASAGSSTGISSGIPPFRRAIYSGNPSRSHPIPVANFHLNPGRFVCPWGGSLSEFPPLALLIQ